MTWWDGLIKRTAIYKVLEEKRRGEQREIMDAVNEVLKRKYGIRMTIVQAGYYEFYPKQTSEGLVFECRRLPMDPSIKIHREEDED